MDAPSRRLTPWTFPRPASRRGKFAAAIGATIAVVLMTGLTAAPAQAATCTTTVSTFDDLRIAFASAPATGAVICLGADITRGTTGNGSTDYLDVPAGANVTFDLNGHTLGIELTTAANSYAGIDVALGETLTIVATGGGSLTVSTSTGGAGIGGSGGIDAGTVIIDGGTITTTSGYDGAGIGGGQNGSGGTITINGGVINASTTNCGAGIGAGEYAVAPGSITINGGIVTATGSCASPGIGGATGVSGGLVTIAGGTVVATGGQGAGIGGGFQAAGGDVTISGGDVTATSALGAAGIGSGAVYLGQTIPASGTLTLIGSGSTTVGSGSNLYASSPTATVQAGPAGVTFVQTSVNGDAISQSASTHIVFTVANAPQITSGNPTTPTLDHTYSFPVTASGTGPITFAVTSGTLPDGLTLDPATGIISGTPTKAGTFSFTISATNSAGFDTQEYVIVVPVTVTVTPQTPAATTILAHTGEDSSGAQLATILGSLMVLAGAMTFVITRRRRTEAEVTIEARS